MKLTFLTLLCLGLFVGRSWACDSYEECMKPPVLEPYNSNDLTSRYAKAIAYKLDEISKKLDKPEPEYVNTGGPILFKKENMKKGKLS